MAGEKLLDLVRALIPEVSADLRIAVVTATVGNYITTDITGTAKITTNSDMQVATGDRVLLLQKGNAFIAIARLSGNSAVGFMPVGSLTMFAGTTVPNGWLLANGATLSRAAYPALFAVIGTTYGAPSGTQFSLPNLSNRFPVGTGTRSPGDSGGAESVTLTAAQMPSHTHTTPDHTHTLSHTHSVPRGGGATTVASGTGASVASTASTTTGSASTSTTSSANGGNTGSAGSGQSFNNMPPYLAIPFIIRAT